MARTEMKWYGGAISRKIAIEMRGRLTAAGEMYSGYAKQQIISRTNRDGKNPSAPGEFPKQRKGWLHPRIVYEIDANGRSGRWGTNVPYGRFLELGTRFMRRRPWMSLTNAKIQPRVRRMMKLPMRSLR